MTRWPAKHEEDTALNWVRTWHIFRGHHIVRWILPWLMLWDIPPGWVRKEGVQLRAAVEKRTWYWQGLVGLYFLLWKPLWQVYFMYIYIEIYLDEWNIDFILYFGVLSSCSWLTGLRNGQCCASNVGSTWLRSGKGEEINVKLNLSFLNIWRDNLSLV